MARRKKIKKHRKSKKEKRAAKKSRRRGKRSRKGTKRARRGKRTRRGTRKGKRKGMSKSGINFGGTYTLVATSHMVPWKIGDTGLDSWGIAPNGPNWADAQVSNFPTFQITDDILHSGTIPLDTAIEVVNEGFTGVYSMNFSRAIINHASLPGVVATQMLDQDGEGNGISPGPGATVMWKPLISLFQQFRILGGSMTIRRVDPGANFQGVMNTANFPGPGADAAVESSNFQQIGKPVPMVVYYRWVPAGEISAMGWDRPQEFIEATGTKRKVLGLGRKLTFKFKPLAFTSDFIRSYQRQSTLITGSPAMVTPGTLPNYPEAATASTYTRYKPKKLGWLETATFFTGGPTQDGNHFSSSGGINVSTTSGLGIWNMPIFGGTVHLLIMRDVRITDKFATQSVYNPVVGNTTHIWTGGLLSHFHITRSEKVRYQVRGLKMRGQAGVQPVVAYSKNPMPYASDPTPSGFAQRVVAGINSMSEFTSKAIRYARGVNITTGNFQPALNGFVALGSSASLPNPIPLFPVLQAVLPSQVSGFNSDSGQYEDFYTTGQQDILVETDKVVAGEDYSNPQFDPRTRVFPVLPPGNMEFYEPPAPKTT